MNHSPLDAVRGVAHEVIINIMNSEHSAHERIAHLEMLELHAKSAREKVEKEKEI